MNTYKETVYAKRLKKVSVRSSVKPEGWNENQSHYRMVHDTWKEYIADERYRMEEKERCEIEEKIHCMLSGYQDDEVIAEAVGMELKAILDYSA